MDRVFHNPGSVFPPPGRYTHAVEVPAGQRMVFLSGQVPVALDGKVPETLAGQADQVYASITAILAPPGACRVSRRSSARIDRRVRLPAGRLIAEYRDRRRRARAVTPPRGGRAATP